jgi:predicted amidohydrolase YtcJ
VRQVKRRALRSASGPAVALAALLAACGGAALLKSAPPAEPIVIVGARLWGVPEHDAVLVEGDTIRAVGSGAELRVAASGANVIDAERAWVLPGFHDAHVHVLEGGLALDGLALGELDTLASVLEAVRERATRVAEPAWVVGHGWKYDIVDPGSFPTRHALDSVVPDRPVWLVGYDGHAGWANTRALELAGIGPATADPPLGRIARESDGATPGGVLLEGAMALVARAVPPATREQKLSALERALAHMVALGVTSLDDFENDAEVFELYDELAASGRMPIRVAVSLPLEGDLDRLAELRDRRAGRNPSFGYLKGFVDGVIESRTAYLLEPYENAGGERGAPRLPPERLDPLVAAAHERGFAVALHAIGDGAVRIALDAIERAQRAHPEVRATHRIEHIEVIHPDDAWRFAALGVVASMQPFHANPFGDTPEQGVWSRNLGAARLRHSFAWRDLASAGATLAFGSDWPVMTADPLMGLAVAITRQDARGRPAVGWNPGQKIELDEAVAAYAAGRRIAPGQPADLVVLEPPVELRRPSTLWKDTRVRAVIGAGRVRATAAR